MIRRMLSNRKNIALAAYFAVALLAAAPRLCAQPAIAAVENAAGDIDPRMPNGGIAQGAIFVVYGSGLGPANTVVAPATFQTTNLSNTSVAVTVSREDRRLAGRLRQPASLAAPRKAL